MATISLIAAAAENNAIGSRGGIPWHISADFKYFKSVTCGHTVIMGRGTWDSMGGKALPGRRNIVVSRSLSSESLEGAETAGSMEAALEMSREDGGIFIIGGGSLYSQTINIANKIYLTRVHTAVRDADTFFPEIDLSEWKETSRSEMLHDEKSGLNYEFIIYSRNEA